MQGDEVVIKLHPKSQWKSGGGESNAKLRPTGAVVAIAQRRWKDFVCTIDDSATPKNLRRDEKLLAIPFDRRIQRIRIATGNFAGLVGQRFVVRMDDWPLASTHPNGHVIRAIGPANDLDTETRTLLIENELFWDPYPESQLADLANSEFDLQISKRRDLRESHLIYSIDPKGCQDVDDALSVREFQNGFLELGVHIADVSHFVRAGSWIDKEAARRTTTVYLADTVEIEK